VINRILGVLLFILLSPILGIVGIIIFVDDGMPILFTQKRFGLSGDIFNFYKFRTMKKDTPNIATHLLYNPEKYLLSFGKVLRKYSVDELPNLLNIIKGDMVFIGPRPALYNQEDLIQKRRVLGINKLKPGITGWAQVNGRDELSISEKVKFDEYYLENRSFYLNLNILIMTIKQIFINKGVSH
jgi:O-antigen biosynthesis protein WbqP